MEICLYTEKDFSIWERFIQSVEESTHYHQIGWKKIIEKSFGHRTFYLLALDGKELKGILPLVLIKNRLFNQSLVSLPFLNYGGICAENGEAQRLLLEGAINLLRELNIKCLELRHRYKTKLQLVTKEEKATLTLKLDQNPENLWKSLDPKVRNQVRKAIKSGLIVKRGGLEYLNEFYECLAINMRDLGSPVHSKEFFRNILVEFSDSVSIFVVCLNSQVIGGAFTLSFKDSLEVPWASAKREYFFLCPNNLLYWEMIKYGCERGFRYFDFGRSSWNSGTFRFKKQWGANPSPLYWQYYLLKGEEPPDITYSSLKYRLFSGTWKRLPLGLTQILGPKIRKYISA